MDDEIGSRIDNGELNPEHIVTYLDST